MYFLNSFLDLKGVSSSGNAFLHLTLAQIIAPIDSVWIISQSSKTWFVLFYSSGK